MAASPSKRCRKDLVTLFQEDFKVCAIDDGVEQFHVLYYGPAAPDSLYDGGVWKVRVELPKEYPVKPPLLAFTNKIYHPNVDQESGSVCPEMIEQAWKPKFDLVRLFKKILPRLLLHPNLDQPPLNEEAASMMVKDPPLYDVRVRDFRDWYGKTEDAGFVQMKPSGADPQPALLSKTNIEHDDSGARPDVGRVDMSQAGPVDLQTLGTEFSPSMNGYESSHDGPLDPRTLWTVTQFLLGFVHASGGRIHAGPVDPRPQSLSAPLSEGHSGNRAGPVDPRPDP